MTYLGSLFTGSLYALIVPNLGVFLADGLDARPFLVGLFFVLMSLSSIAYAQLIGYWSDKGIDRKLLFLAGMIAGACSCFVFSVSRNYLVVLLAGMLLFSLSFASTAQILALAREFADEHFEKTQNSLFNSIIRACVAIAWVAGPPFGFLLQKKLGYEQQYLVIGIAYLAVGIFAFFSLPQVNKKIHDIVTSVPQRNTIIFLGLIAFSILNGTNQGYLIALPLFLPEKFGIESHYAGWLMGTAAFLEIPVMIFAGWLGSRIPLLRLMRWGGISGIIMFTGLWFSSAYWQLFPLQIFNAIFIGFIAGLGMTWFQDLLPDKAGSASALYINCTSAGNVLGSLIVAIFADVWSYHSVFAANIGFSIIAVAILFYIGVLENPKKNNALEIS